MNTELLRSDDELAILEEARHSNPLIEAEDVLLLVQRLIEEREKNSKLRNDYKSYLAMYESMRKRAENAEAELATARKDRERLDWLFKVGDAAQHSRAAIDAAMKEMAKSHNK